MNTREIWRSVPSVEGALASSFGRVMLSPFRSGNPRTGFKQYGGVPTFGQWDGSRFIWRCGGRTYKVARLVCEAFHGCVPFERAVCMHSISGHPLGSPREAIDAALALPAQGEG